jgi:hypothetical protein
VYCLYRVKISLHYSWCANTESSRVASVAVYRYETWPDADSPLDSSSTNSHSTSMKCWRWNIPVRRCQVTTRSSIPQYEPRYSGPKGFHIIWEHLVNDYPLISQSVAISPQLYYTNFRLGSLNRKNRLMQNESRFSIELNLIHHSVSSNGWGLLPKLFDVTSWWEVHLRLHVLQKFRIQYNLGLIIALKWLCLHSSFRWCMLRKNCKIKFLM